MKHISLAGRILFALPFGILGLNHFFMKDFFIGQYTSFIPLGGFTIILSGMALIAACISIIANKYVQVSCLLLALLLLIFILSIHIPGIFESADAMGRNIAIMELLKDTALLGGALFIAGMQRETKEVKQ